MEDDRIEQNKLTMTGIDLDTRNKKFQKEIMENVIRIKINKQVNIVYSGGKRIVKEI